MATNEVNPDRVVASAGVLANCAELTRQVIMNIAGNDISNSINGSKITSEIISNLVTQRIRSNLQD